MDLAKVMSVTGLGNGHVDEGLGRLETCGKEKQNILVELRKQRSDIV